MSSNVIAFTGRAATTNIPPVPSSFANARDNVVSLAHWFGKAIPHRTPTGVYFTTRVLVAPGNIA